MCPNQLKLIQFRPMSLGNLSLVLENERCSYAHPWSKGVFVDCMQLGHECWVVTRLSEIVGHGVLSVAGGKSHLQNVCIHPDTQGRGFGRALVEFMLLRARSHGLSQVFLEIRASNLAAYELYEALGFNETGIRSGYYPANGWREDTIIFAMELLYEQ